MNSKPSPNNSKLSLIMLIVRQMPLASLNWRWRRWRSLLLLNLTQSQSSRRRLVQIPVTLRSKTWRDGTWRFFLYLHPFLSSLSLHYLLPLCTFNISCLEEHEFRNQNYKRFYGSFLIFLPYSSLADLFRYSHYLSFMIFSTLTFIHRPGYWVFRSCSRQRRRSAWQQKQACKEKKQRLISGSLHMKHCWRRYVSSCYASFVKLSLDFSFLNITFIFISASIPQSMCSFSLNTSWSPFLYFVGW